MPIILLTPSPKQRRRRTFSGWGNVDAATVGELDARVNNTCDLDNFIGDQGQAANDVLASVEALDD